MRIMHLADLHIGKRVNGFNMIEDQKFALDNILKLVEKQEVDVVMVAGDVYDLTVPSSEAIGLFDYFITSLSKMSVKVLLIAGNHDSSERLSFAKTLIKDSGIYVSRTFDNVVEKITLEDEYGPLNFYLLPFIKPIMVKRYYPELKIDDFQSAISNVINGIDLNVNERNIILSHQFIVGATTSESEELYLGGLESISVDIYKDFDYVALGHLHKRQSFRDGMVRYPGSLLKYSQSESDYIKKITILDFKSKGIVDIQEADIEYLRDMRNIKDFFHNIISKSTLDNHKDDYIHITLYDEDEILDAISRLREIYPNIMSIRYENKKTEKEEKINANTSRTKSPYDLFNEFYEYRNNVALDERKSEIIKKLIDDVWANE
ncbi:MAG: exonuclease SbcCD subunit D [Tissierellia bacterium]|nr:exonuclease SbcCD subunit D [Tissierellia bacterium]